MLMFSPSLYTCYACFSLIRHDAAAFFRYACHYFSLTLAGTRHATLLLPAAAACFATLRFHALLRCRLLAYCYAPYLMLPSADFHLLLRDAAVVVFFFAALIRHDDAAGIDIA